MVSAFLAPISIVAAFGSLLPANTLYAAGRTALHDCAAADPDRRIAACTRLLQDRRARATDRAAAYYHRGNGHLQKEEYARAIRDFSQAIRLDPKSPRSYNSRAIGYREKGDPDRAIADFNRAIRLNRKYTLAYNNRAIAYGDKGNFERAIADYSAAIALDSKYVIAYYNRAKEFRDHGHFDRAIADLSVVIGLEPNDDEAYRERGKAHLDNGEPERAIADFTAAIRIDPNEGELYIDRGNAYRDRGDYERAIDDYGEAIRIDPKDVDAHRHRAIAHFHAGERAKAQTDLQRAGELSPQNPHVALWQAIVERRNTFASGLAQGASQLDMSDWPAPVIRLFRGELTPAKVLAAAQEGSAKRRRLQVCEANFYSAEFTLMQGGTDEAGRLFRVAASECPHSLTEWGAANAELKALGVTP